MTLWTVTRTVSVHAETEDAQGCDYCHRPAVAHIWTQDREYVTCGGLCAASRNAAWFVVPLTDHDQCAYCGLRAVALMGRDNDGLGHKPTCGGVCRPSRHAADNRAVSAPTLTR